MNVQMHVLREVGAMCLADLLELSRGILGASQG
jgi:hypothetical protein